MARRGGARRRRLPSCSLATVVIDPPHLTKVRRRRVAVELVVGQSRPSLSSVAAWLVVVSIALAGQMQRLQAAVA